MVEQVHPNYSKENLELKIILDHTVIFQASLGYVTYTNVHAHTLFFVVAAVLILQVEFPSLWAELFKLEITVSQWKALSWPLAISSQNYKFVLLHVHTYRVLGLTPSYCWVES